MIGNAHLINLRTGEILENLAEHGSYVYDNYEKFGLKEEDLVEYNPSDTESFLLKALKRGWARVRYGSGVLSLEHFRASRQQLVDAIGALVRNLNLNPNNLSIRIEDFNNRSGTNTLDYDEFKYQYANAKPPLLSSSLLSIYENID